MPESRNYYAHPSAVVDEPVTIGAGTKIWHWVHIMEGAEIGKDCVLGQNVYVGGKVRMGNNVKIQNNVSVYDRVILEDDVFCGPSMVFTNVINPRSQIERKDEYRTTRVRKGASIGANATIICGNTVGRYAFVGAGAVVTEEVGDYGLVAGVPARQIGWVSRAGLRLTFDEKGRARCPETGQEYKLENNKVKFLSK